MSELEEAEVEAGACWLAPGAPELAPLHRVVADAFGRKPSALEVTGARRQRDVWMKMIVT